MKHRTLVALLLPCFLATACVAVVVPEGGLAGLGGARSFQFAGPERTVLLNPCSDPMPQPPSNPSPPSNPCSSSPSSNGGGGGGGSSGIIWAVAAALIIPLLIWLVSSLWGALTGGSDDIVPIGSNFEPDRVVVGITLASPEEMQTIAEALAADYGLELRGVHALEIAGDGLVLLEAAGIDPQAKAQEIAADDRVRYAQPDFHYDAAGDYDDTFAEMSYGPRLVGADRAHAVTRGRNVKVAVIDSAIASDHPELAPRIVEQVDVTGFGLGNEIHGTAVAGVLAAEANNAQGIYGVAPGARLIGIKACHPEALLMIDARCWSSSVARGIDTAVRRDARILNLSIASRQDDALVRRLIGAAVGRDRLVVAAAGNDGPQGLPTYPASLPGVVAVTAVDSAEGLYAMATRGDFVAVAAPGVDIVSVTPGGEYPVLSGTSFATAYVSGAGALLLEANPQLSAAELGDLLRGTARDLGDTGADPEFGSGLLDTCAALASASGGQAVCEAAVAQQP